MSKKPIEIVEVSPRDGLQNESKVLSAEDRAALVLKAAKAGAVRIEAASFVNPKLVPQMADAEHVIELSKAALTAHNLSANLVGLALNARGFQRAIDCQVDEINGVVVASETFNRRNQKVSIVETMAQMSDMAGAAREAGIPFSMTIAASFGCPFEGETDPGLVAELAAQSAEIGAFEVGLADTIGVGSPKDIKDRFSAAMARAPGVQWRCHFHNTRNTGLANAVAAIETGVTVLDASIGGIGGCPFAPAATGNIPTEDLAYMLGRMGYDSGLDLDRLCDIAGWLNEKLDSTPPGMLWKAGNFPPNPNR